MLSIESARIRFFSKRAPTTSACLSLALQVFLAVLFFAAPAFAADPATPQTTPTHHRKAHKKAPPPLVLPPLPAGPLRQVPMDQLPAAPPNVRYENGLLSIGAQNSTLGEVLKQVHELTGATIDIPPSGANERVVVAIGPGAPRDVLATLLNGTSFNYVMLGSPASPAAVASITLTTRAGGEVQTASNMPVQNPATPEANSPVAAPFRYPGPGGFRPGINRTLPGQNPGAPNMGQSPAAADDDSADDDDKDDDSDQPQPGQPGAAGQPQQQQENQDQNSQPNSGPRTPEQILQMMQNGQRPQGMPQPPNQQPPQD